MCLTRMRSALVNAEALAVWARAPDVSAMPSRSAKALVLGREREQTNVLADAVEALVACGLRGPWARRGAESSGRASRSPDHAGSCAHSERAIRKSLLQEQVQARGLPAPTYRVRRDARSAT